MVILNNPVLGKRADAFTEEDIAAFVLSNNRAIRYLMAVKSVYDETSNGTGEIDDWECDLESILFE